MAGFLAKFKPPKPSLKKTGLSKKDKGKKPTDDKERKKEKDGEKYENPGVVSMVKLLDALHEWYWGKGDGPAGLTTKEGRAEIWDQMKAVFTEKPKTEDWYYPTNFMSAGETACWDRLMKIVEALKLPQGKQGRSGTFTTKGVKKRVHIREPWPGKGKHTED